jgi:putative transposase
LELANSSKKYKSNGKFVFSCQYHVIFSPKYRRKVLSNGIDDRLKELILEKQADYGYEILEMEIMPDHVHILIDSDPKYSIHNQIVKIKGYTSRILREEFPSLKTRMPCLWTRSCLISSVGSVSLEVVKKYIENQKNN